MPYIKTLVLILGMAVLVVGGVTNTQPFALAFLDWQLDLALPLWVLVAIAFVSGMVPIFFVGLPEKMQTFTSMRALRTRQRQLAKQLKDLATEKSALEV